MKRYFNKHFFKWIVSFVLTATLAFFVLSNLELDRFFFTLSNLNWVWFAASLGLYAVLLVFRSWRFSILGLKGISFFRIVGLSSIYYFLSNILPFRSGELSFLYMLNTERENFITEGTGILIVSRVFDALSLLLWALLSVFVLFPERVKLGDTIFLGFVSALFLITLFLFTVLFQTSLFRKFLFSFMKILPRKFRKYEQAIFSKWKDLEKSLSSISNARNLAMILALSLLTWMIIYLITIFLFFSLNDNIGFWQGVLATSFPPIISIIPLSTIGNFGTVEAGWVGGLTLIGKTVDTALGLAVALHLLTILLQSISAVLGLIFRRLSDRKTA